MLVNHAVNERRKAVALSTLSRRREPSLNMTRDELDRLDDHDLLVLLHERMKAHEQSHKDGVSTFRWTVVAIIMALGIIVTAAGIIANIGNP